MGLMVISCHKDPNGLRILNLEGEFIISADQVFTDNGPKFSYRITSINDQDCNSSDILYTLIDQEGELNLILEDIDNEVKTETTNAWSIYQSACSKFYSRRRRWYIRN